MGTRGIASSLLSVVLLSACGSTTSTPAPTATPSPTPTPVAGGGGPAGQSQGPGGAGGAGGGPAGTITEKWSEHVDQSGAGFSSVTTQTYNAVVRLSLTKVDIGAWTLAGVAEVTSSYTNDSESHMTTPIGPCNTHYTDDASGSGKVDVDGGLEARDGLFQFYVNIPSVDGSNDTVRDDSGCNGPNNRETTPWSVAQITTSGSGNLTDPLHIAGSTTVPREGGNETVTWDITLNP